jgi:uncharacterized protein YjiS (DUF1127 family)
MLNLLGAATISSPAPAANASDLLRVVVGAARFLSGWIERRRQLRTLSELDDHLLRDLGLSREDVERACSQSFWAP